MWVLKEPDGTIVAFCIACRTDEAAISNWQKTEWADGMMEPVDVHGPPVDPSVN